MTKKDYELIAGVFKTSFANFNESYFTVATVARLMAKKLAQENSRFDKNKFLTACGIED